MRLYNLIKKKHYERVEHVLRRHPLTFLPIFLFFLVLLVVPPVVYILINSVFPGAFQSDITFVLLVLLASSYYLGMLLLFYAQFLMFYLDMWVITNDRMVNVDQLGLFARSISEVELFRLQDVHAEVRGFFRTILKYGKVSAKTASGTDAFVLHDVKRPNRIREDLVRLAQEDRQHHGILNL